MLRSIKFTKNAWSRKHSTEWTFLRLHVFHISIYTTYKAKRWLSKLSKTLFLLIYLRTLNYSLKGILNSARKKTIYVLLYKLIASSSNLCAIDVAGYWNEISPQDNSTVNIIQAIYISQKENNELWRSCSVRICLQFVKGIIAILMT